MNVYTLLYIKKKTDTYTYDHTLYIYNTSKIQEHTKKIHTENIKKYNTFNTLLKKLPDTVQFKKLSRIYLIFFLLFIFLSYLSS